jgi:AhpD family alkylhydroperoxidase
MPAPYFDPAIESDTQIQTTYKEIKTTLRLEKVPALFRSMSVFPAYLNSTWAKYRTIPEGGEVKRKDKEIIGLATAVAHSCDYMVGFQEERLEKMGITPNEIVEALAVADFFEGFDAFAHALHVDSELRPRRMMGGDFTLVDKEIDVNVPYVMESENATVQRIYQDIRTKFGIPFVPNIFKAMAHVPAALETKWASYHAIMLHGRIPRLTKELVAVAVSAVHGCHY